MEPIRKIGKRGVFYVTDKVYDTYDAYLYVKNGHEPNTYKIPQILLYALRKYAAISYKPTDELFLKYEDVSENALIRYKSIFMMQQRVFENYPVNVLYDMVNNKIFLLPYYNIVYPSGFNKLFRIIESNETVKDQNVFIGNIAELIKTMVAVEDSNGIVYSNDETKKIFSRAETNGTVKTLRKHRDAFVLLEGEKFIKTISHVNFGMFVALNNLYTKYYVNSENKQIETIRFEPLIMSPEENTYHVNFSDIINEYFPN